MGNSLFKACCHPTYDEVSDVSEEYRPYRDNDSIQDLDSSCRADLENYSPVSELDCKNVSASECCLLNEEKEIINFEEVNVSQSDIEHSVLSLHEQQSFIKVENLIDIDGTFSVDNHDQKISQNLEKGTDSSTVIYTSSGDQSTTVSSDIFTSLSNCIFSRESLLASLSDETAKLVAKNSEDPTLNFSCLSDINTVKFVSNSKFFFILRGLSGSGKSYLARMLQSTYKYGIICSADDYFWHNGQYEFNREGLQSAHNYCQQRALQGCREEIPVIIIDNTNIKYWEMKPYVKMAKDFNYIVLLLSPRTSWSLDVDILSKVNKHGVDRETIQHKLHDFSRPILPRYYGWFLNQNATTLLKEHAEMWLSKCLLLPGFIKDFGWEREAFDWQLCYEETKYGMHCTALFCKDMLLEKVHSYSNSSLVMSSLGKTFVLHIAGYFLTEDCWGAIVTLAKDQLDLYAQSDILFDTVVDSNLRAGTRAHVTLGVRRGVPHVKCGYDLLKIAGLHVSQGPRNQFFVPGGVITTYEHKMWCIYLTSHFHVVSCFTGSY